MINTEGRTILVDDMRAEGLARTVGGKLQDAVGNLTGDTPRQARGKVNQNAGEAQNMWVQSIDKVCDLVADQPFTALLAATSLGAAVGFFTTRR